MPEMHVRLRWPDGTDHRVYSPSLVLAEHLEQGASYPVDELLRRSRTALVEASDRVEAKYGFPCSRAAASLTDLEDRARRHPAAAEVVVLAVET